MTRLEILKLYIMLRIFAKVYYSISYFNTRGNLEVIKILKLSNCRKVFIICCYRSLLIIFSNKNLLQLIKMRCLNAYSFSAQL